MILGAILLFLVVVPAVTFCLKKRDGISFIAVVPTGHMGKRMGGCCCHSGSYRQSQGC